MHIRGYESQSKIMLNQLTNTAHNMARHEARLSSGDSFKGRIDNPSDVIRASRAEAVMRGNRVAERNIQDGIAFLDVKDSALDKMDSIGQRLRELATEYQDGTKSGEELGIIKKEAQSLIEEMEYTQKNTTYNGKNVFVNHDTLIQAGDKTGDKMTIKPTSFTLHHLKELPPLPPQPEPEPEEKPEPKPEPKPDPPHGGDKGPGHGGGHGGGGWKGGNKGHGGGGKGHGSGGKNHRTDNHHQNSQSLANHTQQTEIKTETESEPIDNRDIMDLVLNPDFIDKHVINPIAKDRASVAIERNVMEVRLDSVVEEATHAESELNRVRDTDVAKEFMALTKQQLLADVNANLLTRSMDEHRQRVLSLLY